MLQSTCSEKFKLLDYVYNEGKVKALKVTKFEMRATTNDSATCQREEHPLYWEMREVIRECTDKIIFCSKVFIYLNSLPHDLS